MKNKSLEPWLPCQSYCQMNGAAAAILSFQNTIVVLNAPSWCSLVLERELMAYQRDLSKRLYCSHIEQADLLFGTGDRIREIVEDQQRENPETSLLAVLTSCSVGLIGDDVSAIVTDMEQGCPLITLDAGGLTGLFEEGYQTAMLAILEKLDLQKAAVRQPKRVNLIGYCGYYPDSRGDLIELKRLLTEAGFEPGICPGESGLDLQDLKDLSAASLNIVISPELGLRTARYLQEKTGVNYAVLPVPYGCSQTLEWLKKVGEHLSIAPDLKTLEQEALVLQENILEEVDALKRIISNLSFKQAILALPYTQAKGLGRALQDDILEVETVKYKIQGNYDGEEGTIQDDDGSTLTEAKESDYITKTEFGASIRNSNEEEWLASDYRLLFGTFADRSLTGDYDCTIYLNMFKADGLIRRKYRTFVGLEGWGSLIEEIVEQTLTLYFLKEERRT
ncbi:MAG: hypothetical protein IJV12_08550 [Acidaminococcaceae bacterium]|nr:hypothetical protein [Acidaminococcaceae bacterium]